MTQFNSQSRRSEGGFTLVELAIVMIIIGLLIGGILKGQELINNARVSSSVSQLKGIEAAINTFRDKYSAIPGDIASPTTRIPNCATGSTCATAGDADGLVDGTGDVGAAPADNEAGRMFIHLAAANMLSGNVNPGITTWAAADSLPNFNLGGNVRLSYSANAAPTGITSGATLSGHYMAVGTGGANTMAAANVTLAASGVANIDRKLDDGAPNTGSVLGAGPATGAAVTSCASGTGASDTYNEQYDGKVCGLFVRALN